MPSTVIKSFSYDPAMHRLGVVYVYGLKYDYLKVPKEKYEEMKAASSKGIYLNQNIKRHYSFKKVE
jgi:hypothetical protein